MVRAGQCGNGCSISLTDTLGNNIFKKRHSPGRKYEFYRELFLSEYLATLDRDLTPRVIACDPNLLEITFEGHQAISFNDNSAEEDYLDKVAWIHHLVREARMPCTLYAKEALVSSQELMITLVDKTSSYLGTESKEKNEASVYQRMHGLIRENFDLLDAVIDRLHFISPVSEAIFSHADFGLQNCVRNSNNELLIVDLEYSGMDSPVKQYFDCILHPRNSFGSRFTERWEELFLKTLISRSDLPELATYGAAFALKWMFIVLNEFIPTIWERRVFASEQRSRKKTDALIIQLTKAQIYARVARDLFKGNDLVTGFTQSDRAQLKKSY